jgi:hypothetical protein
MASTEHETRAQVRAAMVRFRHINKAAMDRGYDELYEKGCRVKKGVHLNDAPFCGKCAACVLWKECTEAYDALPEKPLEFETPGQLAPAKKIRKPRKPRKQVCDIP